jgi:hypothetical protein
MHDQTRIADHALYTLRRRYVIRGRHEVYFFEDLPGIVIPLGDLPLCQKVREAIGHDYHERSTLHARHYRSDCAGRRQEVAPRSMALQQS